MASSEYGEGHNPLEGYYKKSDTEKFTPHSFDGIMYYPYSADKWGARPVKDYEQLAETTIHTYGAVALLAVYGSDQLIKETAQVSYGKGTTKKSHTSQLLRYLMRHKHTSPFEHCELTFYIRMPIFVCRQLIRHRTANVNEYSARYSELSNDFFVPEAKDLARQSLTNRQGRGEDAYTDEEAEAIRQAFVSAQDAGHQTYRELLDKYGVTRELARVTTSVGTYTEMYWKCDLHNFFHFLKLRVDPHAQKEIRDFAQAMLTMGRTFFPLSFEAWNDYILHSYTLSKMEVQMLKEIFAEFKPELLSRRWPHNTYDGMSDREHTAFCQFLDNLLK